VVPAVVVHLVAVVVVVVVDVKAVAAGAATVVAVEAVVEVEVEGVVEVVVVAAATVETAVGVEIADTADRRNFKAPYSAIVGPRLRCSCRSRARLTTRKFLC
jgi:hypothetical protein